MTEDVEIEDKDAAREAIHYALNSEHTVLEFTELDNGKMNIVDITEHHRQLEKMHANNDPAEPIDQ